MPIIKPSIADTAELTYRDYARNLPDGVTFISGNEFTVDFHDAQQFTVKLRAHGTTNRPGSIRMDQSKREVYVSMPIVRQNNAAHNECWLTQQIRWTVQNVCQNRHWIVNTIKSWGNPIPFVPGAKIPYRGGEALLVRDDIMPGGLIEEQGTLDDNYAMIFANGGASKDRNTPQVASNQFRANVRKMLKEEIHWRMSAYVKKASQILNVNSITRVDINNGRNNKVWGQSWKHNSVNKGWLEFNWRLIAFSDNVLWTMASHEVAHQHEMNHSKRFWKLVEQCDPNYKANHAELDDSIKNSQAMNLDT